MRKTQSIKFWKGQDVVELRKNNKAVGWYGHNLNKQEVQSAQKLIEGVENE